MLKRIGYPCVSLQLRRTTNRTCRLKSATSNRLRDLIQQNLEDLEFILQHNAEKNWKLFRIGSSVIPFGSHPVNRLRWWEEFHSKLEAIGQFARNADMRLSFHPGQFTVLNSPDPGIVQRAAAELAYSSRFLDELRLDSSHKIVIHLGGVYDNKAVAIKRFCDQVDLMPDSVKDRLVIENDERNYTVSEALLVSKQTGLPVVFDSLHYSANPGEGETNELLMLVFETWKERDGHPKVHFSSQAEGASIGSHSEDVDQNEFINWVKRWSDIGIFDLMLEAKNKDLAVQKAMEGVKHA